MEFSECPRDVALFMSRAGSRDSFLRTIFIPCRSVLTKDKSNVRIPLTRVGCYRLCLILRSETLVASFRRRVGLAPYPSSSLASHGFVLIFDSAPERVIDAAGTSVNA